MEQGRGCSRVVDVDAARDGLEAFVRLGGGLIRRIGVDVRGWYAPMCLR